MITATVGTAFFVAVVGTSYAFARRRLRYEWWHAVHLLTYAAIALAWFHQIPTGNELVLDTAAADYWRALYVATLVLLLAFRVVAPAVGYFRHRLRVVGVTEEGPGVVSIRMEGRRLERLQAQPGQFFLWRFLTRDRWFAAHPFSLSQAPDGRSLRITVKALGDGSAGLARLPVGTRVLAEGPFGTFTAAARRREKLLLVAGGIGVTPVRALLEQLRGDVIVLYRVVHETELVLRDELHELAARHGFALHEIVGDHRDEAHAHLLTAPHLRELVPDLGERDVFLCGPPGLANHLLRELRAAGVPRSHVHLERFAL
ncbi:MAG: oxidoreductase [Actinobacteria bacterium]|nr:oxidoreductase [Actinomycetota bacterium]